MKMPKPWGLLGVFLCFVLLATVGCGNANLNKVEGVVTLDGSPLAGTLVSFIPVGPDRAATGLTDRDGYFRLTTFRSDDGAMPGEYKVIVAYDDNPEERKDANTLSDEGKMAARKGTMSPQGKKKMAEKRSKKPPSQVPAIYSDIKKTPLKEVVPTNGKVELALRSSMATK